MQPGIIPPIINSPEKIQLARVSHVYLAHPDLDKFHEFAGDFGLVEAGRREDVIYYRGFGRDPCVYVASKSRTGEKEFGGGVFVARTEEDFVKASKLQGASVMDSNPAPGGGKVVSISSPSGTKIHVLWGQEERTEPEKAPSATEISKGEYNSSLKKLRKGTFQRFKVGPAMIHKLGHYGYITKYFDEDVAFYTSNFNFVPSDVLFETFNGQEVDSLTFMHLDLAKEYSDHHTLFLGRAPPSFPEAHQMHHCSFEVEDFDTQLLGHEHLRSKSYTPVWGVGRHILGSQIFDYWKDPSGFTIEHYADGDLVNVNNETARAQSEGPASMYIWGPERPKEGVAS